MIKIEISKRRMDNVYPINTKLLHPTGVKHTSPFLKYAPYLVSGKRYRAELHSSGLSHLEIKADIIYDDTVTVGLLTSHGEVAGRLPLWFSP